MNNLLIVQTGENNPLDGIDLGNGATPQLIAFDGDGDLDIVASTGISIELGLTH